MRRFVLLILLIALAVGGSAGARSFAQTPVPTPSGPAVRLPNHTLSVLSQATPAAPSPQAATPAASQPITLTIVLNRSDPAGFAAFLKGVEDPRSPSFRHFAKQTDLANRFGPSPQAYNAVLAYLQQNGFSLVRGSNNRLTLTVRGTRAQAEQAFSVQIDDYQLGSRSFFANTADPSVPAGIAPSIQAVIGLNNLARPRPLDLTPGPFPSFAKLRMSGAGELGGVSKPPFDSVAAPEVSPSPNASLSPPNPPSPMSIATAYDFGATSLSGANGNGQKIGLVEFDTFYNFNTFPGTTATNSTVAANPVLVANNGTATATITVTLKGSENNPLSSKSVSLSQSGGSTIAPSTPVTTNSLGVASFSVMDNTAETVTYTAKDITDGVVLSDTALVSFAASGSTATNSTLVASKASVPADGATASTITVTLKGASNNLLSGKSVSLAQGSGHSTITCLSNPCQTGTSGATTGQVQFSVTDADVETATYTATDTTDSVTLNQSASVTFAGDDVPIWLTSVDGPCTNDTTCAGVFMGRLSEVNVDGGFGAPPDGGEIEVLLDIDTVMGMAPGANYAVYDAPGTASFQDMFNTMLDDPSGAPAVISNSWGYCEADTDYADVSSIDAILQSAAASGISVYTASGDSGATCSDGVNNFSNNADVPADAPHGTGVGGTTLNVGSNNAYASESWWNAGSPTAGQGGFGVSSFFPLPSYQNGFSSATGRSVPDVSADADPNTGIVIYQADLGGFLLIGGTSLSAQEWAAGTALINQQQGKLTGNLNQVLYAHANDGSFHTASSMTAPNNDVAHLGLGSFDLGNLATALGTTPPPTPTPSPSPTPSPTPTPTSLPPATLSCAAPSGSEVCTLQTAVAVNDNAGNAATISIAVTSPTGLTITAANASGTSPGTNAAAACSTSSGSGTTAVTLTCPSGLNAAGSVTLTFSTTEAALTVMVTYDANQAAQPATFKTTLPSQSNGGSLSPVGCTFTAGGTSNTWTCSNNTTALVVNGSQLQATVNVNNGAGGSSSYTIPSGGAPGSLLACPLTSIAYTSGGTATAATALPITADNKTSTTLSWACSAGSIPAGTTVAVNGTTSVDFPTLPPAGNVTELLTMNPNCPASGSTAATQPNLCAAYAGPSTETLQFPAPSGGGGGGGGGGGSGGGGGGPVPTASPPPSVTPTPTPTPAATPPATATPTPTPTPGCATVSVATGWNLLGGPSGAVLTGAAGALFTFQAGDSAYQTITPATTPLVAPEGYWAFFFSPTTVTLPCVSGTSITIQVPANHFIMVGDPFDRPATLSGAQVIDTFNTAANSYSTSTGTATLAPGQGAWVFSASGGTLTITSG